MQILHNAGLVYLIYTFYYLFRCSYWLVLGALFVVAYNYGHYQPFLLSLLLVLIGFAGLGISIFPYIIPPSISIWQAAAPVLSQKFMLVGRL
ncbi:cytochrome bd ubiquinol oxidase subunit II [Proteus mirabilis]|uniref:Cytochrome bd ubiquinol oxidase subunit II n=1 Tax=Proteus mirabilis TaxID=584 RepID=A0A379GBH5_PROMI|nr:cytochrome bd ubiquinol oxidase subunit II [Proteus mirabilis]